MSARFLGLEENPLCPFSGALAAIGWHRSPSSEFGLRAGAGLEFPRPQSGDSRSFLVSQLVTPDDGLRLPCRIVRRGGFLIGMAFD
jgi:hypothetical protein